MLNRGDDHLTIFFEYDFVDKKIQRSFKVYHYQNTIHQVIPGETYTKYVKILLLLLGLNLLFSLIR